MLKNIGDELIQLMYMEVSWQGINNRANSGMEMGIKVRKRISALHISAALFRRATLPAAPNPESLALLSFVTVAPAAEVPAICETTSLCSCIGTKMTLLFPDLAICCTEPTYEYHNENEQRKKMLTSLQLSDLHGSW